MRLWCLRRVLWIDHFTDSAVNNDQQIENVVSKLPAQLGLQTYQTNYPWINNGIQTTPYTNQTFLAPYKGDETKKTSYFNETFKKKKRKRNEKSTVIIQTYLPMFDTNLQESKIVFNV